MIIAPPPKITELREGTKLIAGLSHSTVLADIDFETYSPAGYTWNIVRQKYDGGGLPEVGVAVYVEHEDAEVLSCAYNLKDGTGAHLWLPANPPPPALMAHIHKGGLLEAWNSFFEYMVWNKICVRRYGWPKLALEQLRCAKSKAQAFALPGSLAITGETLGIENAKIADGKRLIRKFAIPRKPTKKNPSHRIRPIDDPEDAKRLYAYNLRDIEAEAEISSLTPDLNPFELKFWLCDQRINARGVAVDVASVKNCIAILNQCYEAGNARLTKLTEGVVTSVSQVARFTVWLQSRGVPIESMAEDAVNLVLESYELPPDTFEALTIRQQLGSASVKKFHAMLARATKEGRIHDLFVYHSARTGRAAGTGVQPQNLPNSGVHVSKCTRTSCRRHYAANFLCCPWCGEKSSGLHHEWNPLTVEDALIAVTPGDKNCFEYYFGDAIATLAGCLRGMFIAASAYDLICSDYSAIEAVVLAALAGEEWRLQVFRTHGKIYEMSASKICGISFDEFELYKATSGQHHPMRKKIGKVAELASGYGGWIGAWKAFGADAFFNDEEIKKSILAWRDASPAIVEFWGGQPDWKRKEYYGLEGMAIQAVMNPGTPFTYRGITYFMKRGILYCTLLSGRYLVYHNARLEPSDRRPGTHSLTFEGYNTNPKMGAVGWIRMQTYGGKLCENVVQATARDLLAEAIVKLEERGYPVVLHVHDEIVAEVPEGYGSIEEFERIMSECPAWAKGWPIKASGGWRAKRYAK